VFVGAGSLDRAEYTRSSSFCILPISPRIWYREPDLGKPPAGAFAPRLGLAARGAGAVVLIEGVARPLAPILGRPAADTLGPRECLGGRDACRLARGVAAGSSAMDIFRLGIGVEGTSFEVGGASDKGGDGGVLSGRTAPIFERGGVEAVVGEERVVAEVDASEAGERGRNESPARWFDTLRW
jgi:hypothetical protein